jgi:methyl-accepting chemotaxis protein
MIPSFASSTSSLSRRIVLAIGVVLFLIVGALAWAGSRMIHARVTRSMELDLRQASEQAGLVIAGVVAERERQVGLLASLPAVVDAARLGAERARALGLVGRPLEEAERRYDSTRTLAVDPRTRQFLLDRGASLELAEVLVTEVHGFNVITTDRTSDFVQSDEDWWRQAMATGSSLAEASYDESAKQVSLSVASAVREREGAPAVGVMKVVYGLAALQGAVTAAATGDAIRVELIDQEGRVIASSDRKPDLSLLPGYAGLPRTAVAALVRYDDGGPQRASVRATNGTAWRVVAHTLESLATAEVRRADAFLAVAGSGVVVLLLGALAGVNGFMTRRIARPAALLAAAAESVAAGDLGVHVAETGADDEMGRLARATRGMIAGLRNLTVTIKSSAAETAAMALDLTASSEEISASSQQMAQTSADLTQQAVEMARTIQAMAEDSNRLVGLSAALSGGVAEGVMRNQRLRLLARENRERLDTGARKLEELVAEVQGNAAAAEALAATSEEIRGFVDLVQRMARQSKLLAFSAGLEARRAGPEAAGFVAVANEVDLLATTSSEAAEHTERGVAELLARVKEARASSGRSAVAVESVRRTTHHALESFGHVEAAVADTEAWTDAIHQASRTSNSVVEQTTRRLDALARGTEAFAAAMQEVAAVAQEQSASTEEIVGTAAELSATAERLSREVGGFRLPDQRPALSALTGPRT